MYHKKIKLLLEGVIFVLIAGINAVVRYQSQNKIANLTSTQTLLSFTAHSISIVDTTMTEKQSSVSEKTQTVSPENSQYTSETFKTAQMLEDETNQLSLNETTEKISQIDITTLLTTTQNNRLTEIGNSGIEFKTMEMADAWAYEKQLEVKKAYLIYPVLYSDGSQTYTVHWK